MLANELQARGLGRSSENGGGKRLGSPSQVALRRATGRAIDAAISLATLRRLIERQVTNLISRSERRTARGTEAYLLLWLRLWGTLGSADFNIKVIH